jgi:serine/threonine protein kinase
VRTSEVLSWGLQLAQALGHVASKGFVHLDVACRNVMVDYGSKIKLGDFGLAKPSVPNFRVTFKSRRVVRVHRVPGTLAFDLCTFYIFCSSTERAVLRTMLCVVCRVRRAVCWCALCAVCRVLCAGVPYAVCWCALCARYA